MMDETVELANRHSTAKRLVLAVIGLAVAVWPIWDLWPGIASLSVLSPVFWIIGLGALSLGLALLGGAIFGPGTVLSVRPDGVELQRENLLGARTVPLDPADIGDVTVTAQEWSEGPATWRVTVTLADSKPLMSHDFRDPTGAEALADRLTQALGRRT